MRPIVYRYILTCLGIYCLVVTIQFYRLSVDVGSGSISGTSRWSNLRQFENYLLDFERHLRRRFPAASWELSSLTEAHTRRLPSIYAITPTYARPEQRAELTRLRNTLLHVPKLKWIVVEDANTPTQMVTNFLAESGIPYVHLHAPTPAKYKLTPNDPTWLLPKGVAQRNEALTWLRRHVDPNKVNAVVYFADDDNSYTLRVFEEMRWTNGVSVWPVGLSGGLMYEGPVVNHKTGRVMKFFTYYKPSRPFPLDMAGFAINFRIIHSNPDALFTYEVPRGYQESHLLTKMGITKEDLEPKASNCTKILVWHVQTKNTKLKNWNQLLKNGQFPPTIDDFV